MRPCSWLVSILVVLNSCIGDKDYNLNSVDVRPSIAFPLAFGSLTIQDFLKSKDSVYVKIYPDDVVYLGYSQLLVSEDIRDLFSIPDKAVNQSFKVPAGAIPAHTKDIRSDSLTEVVDFGLNPEQLSEIDFKSGTINYSTTLLPAASNLKYEVILTSSDFTSKTTGLHLNLTATGTAGSLSLADYKVTLNKNKFSLKMVLVLMKTSSPVTVGPNTSVAVNFSLSGMDFNTIHGFFGIQTVYPPSAVISIGAFGTSLNSAKVSFAQPKVTMNVINDYGVPCTVTFSKIEARKNGAQPLPLKLSPDSPISIAYPATLGNSATTPVAITNAKDVLDFAPSEIFYQLSASTNQGFTSGNNFMADTSKMRVQMDVEVPLYGHASGIILKDTAKIDLSKLDQSQIQKASLKVTVINELPLDAKIQLYLTDAGYTVLDSLLETAQTSLVKGSSVSPTGDLETAGVSDQLLDLNVDRLTNVFKSKNIIIRAVMNTSKDAAGNSNDVKFKSKYVIIVNVGLLVDLKFNIKL